MPTDKKISELPLASAIGNSDACLLVSNGTDYQFAMSLLLQYVGSNLSTGANIFFGTSLPQNSSGKNGDTFVNTATGVMAQRLAGVWTVTYTPPTASTPSVNNKLLYGLGLPAPETGTNGDTYINTNTGIFYKKTAGSWAQVFSMQSGPAGPPGSKGDPGPRGNDGYSLLNGSTDPSHQYTGRDGDFYINYNSYTLFGPKAEGVWPEGITLLQALPPPVVLDFPPGTPAPITISNFESQYADYGNCPSLIIQEVSGSDTLKERTDIQPLRQFIAGTLTTIYFDVPGNEAGQTINHFQLTIKA